MHGIRKWRYLYATTQAKYALALYSIIQHRDSVDITLHGNSSTLPSDTIARLAWNTDIKSCTNVYINTLLCSR